MSEQEYDDLWHYSEQFTRDKLQRSELVTMAWKEGEKLGARRNMKLMKSAMHFRARELDKRSAFPAEEVGKRTIDHGTNRKGSTLIGQRSGASRLLSSCCRCAPRRSTLPLPTTS